MSRFKTQAMTLQEQMVSWRRHFHMYPEVGHDVPQTASYVASVMRDLGLCVREGIGGHGVIGVLKGAGENRGTNCVGGTARPRARDQEDLGAACIAIRADMDALNVTEETGLEFASKVPGRMHACGHDAHMAMALGAAQLLSAARGEFSGSVKFIFQPAEEGPGGAKPMIDAGALEDPKVDAIIGLHIGCLWDIPTGCVGVRPGRMMAATDNIRILIKGRGGHGAMPHETVDAVCVGSSVISALQTIVSRQITPLEPAVLTIGKFSAGTAHNVIAESALLEGTVRCLNEGLRDKLPKMIERTVAGVCSAMGAGYELEYVRWYPVLENDPGFTSFFAGVARDVLGPDRVQEIEYPTMGGEDMAYYLKKVPGTFFFLASRPARGKVYPHHNPRFDIDESVLWIGACLLAETAWRWLRRDTKS